APQLLGDPLPGEVGNQWRRHPDRLERRRFDLEPERRRHADRPDDAEGVLLEPLARLPDGPDGARPQVAEAVVEVDQTRLLGGRCRPPGEGVDREVAAGQAGLGGPREPDATWPPAGGVVVVGAERRDRVTRPLSAAG